MTVALSLRDFVQHTAAGVPLPGSGQTLLRFEVLADWAARDLSLGRLAEGHTDALAILSEAGAMPAASGAQYGVWAARGGPGGTTATRCPDGWRLTGEKSFCSGNAILDRALITADTNDGYRLFDISVRDHVVDVRPGTWEAIGMADSGSDTVVFGGPVIPDTLAVGGAGFYLDRPGFWFGAVGVAACWYGGARGLVERALTLFSPSGGEVVLTEMGRAVAHIGAMHMLLENAARVIDEDPDDAKGVAMQRALVTRFAIHHGCTRVLEHVAVATGARPLCHDRAQAKRAADLYIYLSQHHGLADAAKLGRLALEDGLTC